jgi:hypothetical protein
VLCKLLRTDGKHHTEHRGPGDGDAADEENEELLSLRQYAEWKPA